MPPAGGDHAKADQALDKPRELLQALQRSKKKSRLQTEPTANSTNSNKSSSNSSSGSSGGSSSSSSSSKSAAVEGLVVADMMAGVGPFAVPLAMAGVEVHANGELRSFAIVLCCTARCCRCSGTDACHATLNQSLRQMTARARHIIQPTAAN